MSRQINLRAVDPNLTRSYDHYADWVEVLFDTLPMYAAFYLEHPKYVGILFNKCGAQMAQVDSYMENAAKQYVPATRKVWAHAGRWTDGRQALGGRVVK